MARDLPQPGHRSAVLMAHIENDNVPQERDQRQQKMLSEELAEGRLSNSPTTMQASVADKRQAITKGYNHS